MRSRGPRPSRAIALAVVVCVLVPPAWVSGETIRDPENPEIEAGDDEEDRDGSEADEADETEVIADPDNPEQPSGEGAESRAEEASDEGAISAGSFRAEYATGVAVDTGWEREGEDVVEWAGRADLRLEQPLSPQWHAVVAGEFEHWIGAERREGEPNYLLNAADPRGAVDVRLGESYVAYRADRWTFRGGHLVTSWGSTDLVRPGDVVNPIDATPSGPPGARGDRLVPQPAVELSYTRPNWSLTGLVVPFFRQNRVAVLGRDAGVAAERLPALGTQFPVLDLLEQTFDRSLYEDLQPLVLATRRPEEFPKHASAGLRATGTRWSTDFGLGYFFGWDRTPYLSVEPEVRELGRLAVEDGQVLQDYDLQGFIGRNPEALELMNSLSEKQREGDRLIESRYRRMHTLLVDVARYLGPVGLRLEAAFQPERTFLTRDLRSVRRPSLFTAVGASYEELIEGRPLALSLEGFWLKPFGAESDLTQWLVAPSEHGEEAEPLLLFEGGYPGLVGAVDWATPLWDLDVRVGSLVELETGGLVVTGQLGRRWASWLRTSIGATIYTGPDPSSRVSLGGLYDPNDRVSLTLEGNF